MNVTFYSLNDRDLEVLAPAVQSFMDDCVYNEFGLDYKGGEYTPSVIFTYTDMYFMKWEFVISQTGEFDVSVEPVTDAE